MKKIAAIHDLSGYGRASLTVAIPILTHMGFQVCPLPTAILSAHSEYKDFRSLDLTDYMESFISHWKELQLQFDAIYTGYLASVKQMSSLVISSHISRMTKISFSSIPYWETTGNYIPA